LAQVTGSWGPTAEGNFLTKVFVGNYAKISLLSLLIGFLAFLVPKLRQNNQNLGKKSFWVIFTQFSFWP